MSNQLTIWQCPHCAAVITFEYPGSNIKECSCGNTLLKSNNTLTVEKSLNNVTVKGYRIKPGSTGSWDKKSFKVYGKMGIWFEESFYSYWFIVFANGDSGYLAEGYGMYSILIPDKDPRIKDSALEHNKIGQVAGITDYQLQKKNSSNYWEVEGELSLENRETNLEVFEYAGEKGLFFTVFKWPNNISEVYKSHPIEFEALHLSPVSAMNPFGKELKCKNCSAAIKTVAYPLSQSCVCSNCGTFYAIQHAQLDQKGNNKKNEFKILLPLGLKGVLKDIEYEVVGFLHKQEQNPHKSKWREYVLFNPAHGFSFLSEYDGHWIFLKEKIQCPVILNDNTKEFIFDDTEFYLYNAYKYKVIEAKGEFPYNAFDNDETAVKEYIFPPWIWIREKDQREGITWFKGEHITPDEITASFTVTRSMPSQVGTGAVEPASYLGLKKLAGISLGAILILFAIHLLLTGNNQNKIILEDRYYFTDSTDKVKVVTEKFDLSKWRSLVSFDIWAPVNNSWFELNATLVNVETGKEYSMEKGVEYYYGYTEGESWTEGDRNEKAYITNIPGGKYFLQIEGTRDYSASGKLDQFSVKAVYDPENFRNLFFAILLMLIWPVLNYVIGHNKEKGRWENSPYSNYNND